ncbi:MAG: PEP-CTERM sorting domain-containing protein [Planctomycetota bacterium]
MRIALCILAVLMMTSSASAINHIWFDVTATGGDAVVVTNGAPGVTAMCEAGPGLSSFHVEVMIDAYGPDGINGYGVRFWEEIIDCPGIIYNDMYEGLPGWTTVGSGGLGLAQYIIAAPAEGVFNVMSFDMDKTGMTLFNEIWGEASNFGGGGDWGNGSALVQFGDGTPHYAFPGYAIGVMMHTDCVPEPATIALLGFGVLALIRRR